MGKIKVEKLTQEEFESKIKEYAVIENQVKYWEALKKVVIDRLKKFYEKKMKPLEAKAKKLLETCRNYADSNKSNLFVEKKSITNDFAVYGFRLGKDAVKTHKGITEKKALQTLLDSECEDRMEFVSVAYSLDKSKINDGLKKLQEYMDAFNKNPNAIMPANLGTLRELEKLFYLDKDENFYIDPIKDKKETK